MVAQWIIRHLPIILKLPQIFLTLIKLAIPLLVGPRRVLVRMLSVIMSLKQDIMAVLDYLRLIHQTNIQ